jgi:hypothetical protein
MLNFNENKITNFFTPITLIFILYMPNYLYFPCVPVPITYKVYFLPVPFHPNSKSGSSSTNSLNLDPIPIRVQIQIHNTETTDVAVGLTFPPVFRRFYFLYQ